MCRSTWCISSGGNLSPQAVFNGFLEPATSGRESKCALEQTVWALNRDISGFGCFLSNNGSRKKTQQNAPSHQQQEVSWRSKENWRHRSYIFSFNHPLKRRGATDWTVCWRPVPCTDYKHPVQDLWVVKKYFLCKVFGQCAQFMHNLSLDIRCKLRKWVQTEKQWGRQQNNSNVVLKYSRYTEEHFFFHQVK